MNGTNGNVWKRLSVLGAMLLPLFGLAATPEEINASLAKADTLGQQGNWKEAFNLYRPALTDPNWDGDVVKVNRVDRAVQCLQQLQTLSEFDDFAEGVVKVHAGKWRVLEAVANEYAQGDKSWGVTVSGKYRRGPHRGGGEQTSSQERDRVRALQLMEQARPLVEKAKDPAAEKGQFFWRYAQRISWCYQANQAWRLQTLTDLGKLPDYEVGNRWGRHYGGSVSRAPVDENGNPVYYAVPKAFEKAAGDGERWRWCLTQAMEYDPGQRNTVMHTWATFLYTQFGEPTLNDYGWFFSREAKDNTDTESAAWKLETLKDGETIARLATGIKRFNLPDDQNFLKIWQDLAGKGDVQAHVQICMVYENRRQYVRAATEWQALIAKHGKGPNNEYQRRLDQIVGNWARFESIPSQAPGKPVFDVVYRNGVKLNFKATRINEEALLSDMQEWLKSDPKNLDWNRMNIDGIGYELVQGRQAKYLTGQPIEWSREVKPAAGHFDRRTTVEAPVKSGAWYIEMKMADGNTMYSVLWVNDLALVRKMMCNQRGDEKGLTLFNQIDSPTSGPELIYVADAVTGKPAANASVKFFGWKQEWTEQGRRHHVYTHEAGSMTNTDGICIPAKGTLKDNYQYWIKAKTEDGRFAILNIGGFWHRESGFQNYDYQYNQPKSYGLTDRPVYRPNQKVQFKTWIGYSRYDADDKASPFAGKRVTVTINDPMGTEIYKKPMALDTYGGLSGELMLPADAKLGMYNISVTNNNDIGAGIGFRVEEYKKPEFEVSVEGPKDPMKLGDKIEALVKAKYYFGGAVTKAKLKIKVTRQEKAASWYPVCRWDWLYDNGYGWLTVDRCWYPGWNHWGWCAPVYNWMPWWRPQPPPEIVQETTADIGPDGTAKVLIDTAAAKAIFGDKDQEYTISAEVTDESRRTITGSGNVLVTVQPFKVYTWLDRGHYRPGNQINASFQARRGDGKPVAGKGEVTLYSITYDKKSEPVEKKVNSYKVDINEEGAAELRLDASKAGQYRLACVVTDAKDRKVEGAILFEVRGVGETGRKFHFNQLELLADKKEYRPGEKIRLAINCDNEDSTVLLFVRAADGICLMPRILYLKGRSVEQEIDVLKKDMPNFYIEALTVHNGEVYSQVKDVCVPPESRALDIAVKPSSAKYKPGAPAKVKLQITDAAGKPVSGSVVIAVYDKSIEYIAGAGALPGDIREVFWKWRRNHNVFNQHNLARIGQAMTRPNDPCMGIIGIFGAMLANDGDDETVQRLESNGRPGGNWQLSSRRKMSVARGGGFGGGGMPMEERMVVSDAMAMPSAAPMAPMAGMAMAKGAALEGAAAGGPGGGGEAAPQVTVRQNFADTAYWAATLVADANGEVEVDFPMPENLTCWKIRAWTFAQGARVGEGSAEVVTSKDLLLRLQAPRFFVEGDEVVLSANIHNYLDKAQEVTAILELDGGALEIAGQPSQKIKIKSGGEERVDWKVKAVREGEVVVRMKALAKGDSDAMQMTFPVVVHGMLKTESWSLAMRPGDPTGKVEFTIPVDRRPEQSRLEVRWSPTLAGAMLDALPYLVEYPYGCTEQTLNKFLPAAITRKVLQETGVDLKTLQAQASNLNAQEIGDDKKRLEQWGDKYGYLFYYDGHGYKKSPVFDQAFLDNVVKEGAKKLQDMQCSDGGWGWFSGHGEYSSAHTTAWVVRGFQIAKLSDVQIDPNSYNRGIEWLKRYQAEEIRRLKLPPDAMYHKDHADELDALVFLVLSRELKNDVAMKDFLYRDRTKLALYAKSLFGLALDAEGDIEKRDMLVRNVEQYLAQDPENQTAYLKLETENSGCWWYWYGSEYEGQASYLKLLAKIDPKSAKASGLVKYLLNNRKHATYWNSTRDTALCVEAFADYLRATGEAEPNMVVELWVDGQKHKEVRVTKENLFNFDNKLVLEGKALTAGKHTLEIRRQGNGPVYANVYSTNFTLEKFIKKAGLEVKVNRDYYKLVPEDKKIDVAGSRGQAVKQKVEKFTRVPLKSGDELKSGDLIEVEMTIDSKNDYEYLVIEDPKPAGCEAVEVRSGYNGNALGAYVEYRDQKACFFVRQLARGTHSVSYRLRAEIPGSFSALPAKVEGMYAPELKGNSDEMKLGIKD